MLDRVAALVEKAGLPRDRVLSDPDLLAAIHERGDTIETFYYGHDYPASALARFFQLADQEHVQLNQQEETLRALLNQLGWLKPGANGALITIPRRRRGCQCNDGGPRHHPSARAVAWRILQ